MGGQGPGGLDGLGRGQAAAAQSVTVSAAHRGRSAGQAADGVDHPGAGSAAVPPAACAEPVAAPVGPGDRSRRAGSRGPGRPAAPAPRRRRPPGLRPRTRRRPVPGRHRPSPTGPGLPGCRGWPRRPAAASRAAGQGPVDPVAAGPGGAAAAGVAEPQGQGRAPRATSGPAPPTGRGRRPTGRGCRGDAAAGGDRDQLADHHPGPRPGRRGQAPGGRRNQPAVVGVVLGANRQGDPAAQGHRPLAQRGGQRRRGHEQLGPAGEEAVDGGRERGSRQVSSRWPIRPERVSRLQANWTGSKPS